ncbi:MAG: hypothetical protein IKN94_06480 [Salinivirgaceae bacterium]|nr:hypothetical protein [Salinivirgaceae bacterium]
MNTNLFKTTIAALALLVAFNSCKEEDNGRLITNDELEQLVLMEDGFVATSLEDLWFLNWEESNSPFGYMIVDYYLGTSPDNMEEGIRKEEIVPYIKYYWKVRLWDSELLQDGHHQYDPTFEYAETEPRSFYYIPTPTKIELHNVEGDWATVLKWEHNDMFEDAQVTMTPNKDCNYDKNPIKVPKGQDSCYISAGTLGNQKYQIYHSWWDEANGKYYEPVIYEFKLTINCNINGDIVPVPISTKGIFLNTDGYVADSNYNVYRYEKIGNKIWMQDDIRAELDSIDDWGRAVCKTITLKSGLKMKVYTDYALKYSDILIPEGFHLASDDDWQDLESHFGIERTNISSYYHGINYLDMYLDTTMPEWWRGRKDWDLYDIYVGEETNIRDYLIFDNEWQDYRDSTKTLKGSHIFNAHPVSIPWYQEWDYGNAEFYKGKAVCFLTSTKYKNEPVIRLLSNVSRGIGRMVTDKTGRECEFYLYRCVKDE